MKPKVGVLRTDGTNCHIETAYVFNLVGCDAEVVQVNSLLKGYDPVSRRHMDLDMFDRLAFAGGFSGGDYIKSGRIFAAKVRPLEDKLRKFVDDGKLMIGICNGFQVLVCLGLLPMFDGELKQTASLTYNEVPGYNCLWTRLVSPPNKCVWTKGISTIDVPVAHGEGRFVAPEATLDRLFADGQVVFQYANLDGTPTQEFPANPNGAMRAVAGICDHTGRVFGWMPHAERYNDPKQHPAAPLQEILGRDYVDRSNPVIAERLRLYGTLPKEAPGLQIFRNAVEYFM